MRMMSRISIAAPLVAFAILVSANHASAQKTETIEAGRTKYTDSAGDPALRDAIAGKYRREQGAACTRENVLVTAGAGKGA